MGLSAKAGKIASGTDSVLEAIEKRKAKLVIVAEDASLKTIENFEHKCREFDIPIAIHLKSEEISNAIGKRNKVVICIKDRNFSDEIYKIICGGEAIG